MNIKTIKKILKDFKEFESFDIYLVKGVCLKGDMVIFDEYSVMIGDDSAIVSIDLISSIAPTQVQTNYNR